MAGAGGLRRRLHQVAIFPPHSQNLEPPDSSRFSRKIRPENKPSPPRCSAYKIFKLRDKVWKNGHDSWTSTTTKTTTTTTCFKFKSSHCTSKLSLCCTYRHPVRSYDERTSSAWWWSWCSYFVWSGWYWRANPPV